MQEQAAGLGTGDIVGIKGLHIECKRWAKRAAIEKWKEQMHTDCPIGSVPILCYRLDGGEWTVVVSLEHWTRVWRIVQDAKTAA